MKSQRIFVTLLLVAGALAVLAGCAGSQAPPPTTPPTTTMPPMTTTAPTTTLPPTTATPAPATTIPTMAATTTQGTGSTVQLTLTAQNIAFDKSTLMVPAGSFVTMTFNNKDAGVPHNFALYTDSHANQKIFAGSFVTGVQTVTYTFRAPAAPGSYFFRCDVHPETMTGTFVVT